MNKKGLFLSLSDKWNTPRSLFKELHAEFKFNFDPCPPNPKFDGLQIEWKSSNFCNPPFSKIAYWVAKGFLESRKGKTVVMLIPSRTDTIWWHDYVMQATEIRFLKGRLKFQNGEKIGRAPFPSAVVVFNHVT